MKALPDEPFAFPDDILRPALDSLSEGLQILSPEWRYLYVNEAAARHGRRPREELLGRTMSECYPGIEQSEMFRLLERCLRERVPASVENEFRYEDGSCAWFELRVQPGPPGLIVLSLDVSERKRLELDLRCAHERTMRELSTPAVRVQPGILLLPLVGTVDSWRAEALMRVLLTRTVEEQARVVILDVSGAAQVDTQVAAHLLKTAAAIRLLGGQTILTGIGPATARTIVDLGLDLSAMRTTSQLSDGIELALSLIGKEIRPRQA